MDKNFATQLMGRFCFQLGKQKLTRPYRKKILAEYQHILTHTKDIGKHNILLSCYLLGVWFIAMNRVDGLSPKENYMLIEEGLYNSRIFRMTLGNANRYLAPKRIEKQKKWAKRTQERQYENDWVVELLPGNGDYDLGYDYLECGICKLCHDEGCPDMTQYLCKLDYMFAKIMGLRLERTSTLAEGGDKCNFRFFRLQ